MQNKMQQHFSSKQEEAEAQSIRLLGEMDSLVRDIKVAREGFSKDNSALEEQLKIIRAQQERDTKESQKQSIP